MGFFYIRQKEQLPELAALSEASVVGVDLETAGKNGLYPQQSRIRLMQLATQTDTFVVDLDQVDPMSWVQPVLTSREILKVFHHAKFDVKHLLFHYQLEVKNIFCTMLASQLLAMGERGYRHSLAEVAKRFLEVTLDKGLQNSDWSGSLSEFQIQYAAEDAEILVRLHKVMAEKLKRHKLQKVSQLEFRTLVPVAAMELRGLYVDPACLDKVNEGLSQNYRQLESEVLSELRNPNDLPGMNTLNLNAPEQVKEALQERGLHIDGTSDGQLRPLMEQYPFLEKLLAFRHLSKILNSTLRPFKDFILEETGRVHPTYHQIASASGRFACSDPNVQQVPREKAVRACFKPQAGYSFVVADYSQVELRVAAGLSGDPIMLDAYAKGGDLHRLTAALTMGKEVADVSKEERQAAKAINFWFNLRHGRPWSATVGKGFLWCGTLFGRGYSFPNPLFRKLPWHPAVAIGLGKNRPAPAFCAHQGGQNSRLQQRRDTGDGTV